VPLQGPGAVEKTAAEAPADRVAEAVAGDRRRRGDRDHERRAQVAAPGEDRGGNERRLAGKGDADALEADEQGERQVRAEPTAGDHPRMVAPSPDFSLTVGRGRS